VNPFLPTQIVRYRNGKVPVKEADELAAEEPLEIRIEGHSVAVLMRTPGNDRELAAGFLVTENLIRRPDEIFEITLCGESRHSSGETNVVSIVLKNPAAFDPATFTRNFFSSSSCGICGKASIDAIVQQFAPITSAWKVSPELLLQLPARLSAAQETFQRTGGLHACALFEEYGKLFAAREDVGRHNALDKLIGYALLEDRLPLDRQILLLSGRVSFEMVQKALAAGIAIITAISAPTSLAVEFARTNNQTLVGFLREDHMNVYAGAERIVSTDRHR
jgi:FdhD protein